MGGGGPETKQTSTVTTNTTTTIRDIGLTGQNAVDALAVLESGAISRNTVTADVINNLIQQTGEGWNRLIGGASDLVNTSRAVSENITSASGQIAQVAAQAVQPDSTLIKMLPWISAATVAIILLLKR